MNVLIHQIIGLCVYNFLFVFKFLNTHNSIHSFCQHTYNRVANHFFKIFLGFPNLFQVLEIHIFGSISNSLKLKTLLKSIKTLKKYCKATLNMFEYIKKILMMTKKKYL